MYQSNFRNKNENLKLKLMQFRLRKIKLNLQQNILANIVLSKNAKPKGELKLKPLIYCS